MTDYSKKFSKSAFWQKVKKFAKAAGKEVIEKALVLYYCLRDPDTPKFARTVIVGALGYFIVPLDAIPDFTPIVGYTDDLGALVAALALVAVHVKAEHKAKTEEKLREWFG
jgi:uncharacterized membrane protein YkvA (DUF1232 family)